MSLTQTQMRKLSRGTQVKLSKATFVRFVRKDDGMWHEVQRPGITPHVYTTAELFVLGVDPVDE